MIQVSANILPLMDDPTVETFYLLDIDSGFIRTTNYFSPVTLSDGRTFASDGLLVEIDNPRLSTVVDREEYKMELNDPDYTYGESADAGLLGRSVEVRLGYVDPVTGLPFTNLADTLFVYGGVVSGTGYDIETEETGEVKLIVTCSGPVASLDATRAMYLTRDGARERNPSDTSCDQVYEGSGPISLRWGKV